MTTQPNEHQSDRIEVYISEMEFLKAKYSELYIMAKLSSAGIPLKGAILFDGVTHGTLLVENKFHGESYVWIKENEN